MRRADLHKRVIHAQYCDSRASHTPPTVKWALVYAAGCVPELRGNGAGTRAPMTSFSSTDAGEVGCPTTRFIWTVSWRTWRRSLLLVRLDHLRVDAVDAHL